MSRPCSVLIVVDTLTDNGSLRWVHKLAALWLEASWAVGYLSLKRGVDGRPPLMPPAGASLTYGDTAERRFRRGLPGAVLRALRAARAADAVMVISEVELSLPFAYVIARLVRRPFVVYVQNVPERSHEIHLNRWRSPLWRHCLTHADAVLCVAPAGAESAARMGVDRSKLTVASTGIDVDMVRRLGSPDGPGRLQHTSAPLVACGELYHRKGYDLLLRALADVRRMGRPVRLVLIGEGQEGPTLKRLAQDLGLSEAVTFTGHLGNPLPEIAQSAAFVHCARVEGVPQVLLEAIALGVPTIATDCDGGGPRMILGGGAYGRLVEPESVPALAEAILAHLNDPSQLTQQAAEGEIHLREHFSPARTAEIVLDVLARVDESRPRRRGALSRWRERRLSAAVPTR